MSTITIAVDSETDDALDAMSRATRRTKAEIAAEAVAACVGSHAEWEAMVREAREDFAEGRTFSHDEVMAGAQAIIEAAKARKA